MSINIFGKGLFTAGYLMMLVAGLFFSMTVRAADVSEQDIDSAYNYYNSVAPAAAPARAPVPAPAPVNKNVSDNSIGGFAESLMQPIHVVSDFMSGMAIIIGMTCLFGGFVRYMQHRVNPLAHPISSVITLFILGIVLVLLPLLNKLVDSGLFSSN